MAAPAIFELGVRGHSAVDSRRDPGEDRKARPRVSPETIVRGNRRNERGGRDGWMDEVLLRSGHSWM